MNTRIMTVVVLGIAMVAPAGATASPAAIELLKRGSAEVRLGPAPPLDAYEQIGMWHAGVGKPLEVEVWGRLPKRWKGGRVYVRSKSPRSRCAVSYARDNGDSVARLRVDRSERSTFTAKTTHTFRVTAGGTTRVRLCVWLARSKRARVKPSTQDVDFYGTLAGTSVTTSGAFTQGRYIVWSAAATVPFQVTEKAVICPPGDPSKAYPVEHQQAIDGEVGGTYAIMSFQRSDCSAESWSWGVQLAGATGMDWLGYTAGEIATGPIKTLGACVLSSPTGSADHGLNAEQAKAYIQAVGCVPGRVIERPRPGVATPAGQVYELEVHGGTAVLAPRCTSIDIVVQAPKPRLVRQSGGRPAGC